MAPPGFLVPSAEVSPGVLNTARESTRLALNTELNTAIETANKKTATKILTIGDDEDNFAISLPQSQTEATKISKPLETKQFSDTLSILFGNIQGLRTQKQADKLSRLSKLCQNDHLLCLNETNLREKDATLLVKGDLGKICKIKSLDNIKFLKGKRVLNNKRLKRSGFGTAMVSHRPDLMNLHVCTDDHEIVYAKIKSGDFNGLVITGYRSPSSKDDTDTANFYSAIDTIIKSNGGTSFFDFIIFVGDDNASSESSCAHSRKAAGHGKNIFNNHQMVDLIPGMMTRGNKQPDNCFGYFNPELIDVQASILVGLDSDHSMIQVRIMKNDLVPELPKFKVMKRRKQCVSNNELQLMMKNSSDSWLDYWSSVDKATIDENKVNKSCAQLIDCVQAVYQVAFKTVDKLVFCKARKEDSSTDVNILRLRAKIQKLAYQIKRVNGVNIQARRKMVEVNAELNKVILHSSLEKFQRDMEAQQSAEQKNDAKFWDLTGSLLNKNAYQTSVDNETTKEEFDKKLEAIDKTFINSNAKPVVKSDYADVEVLEKFDLCKSSEELKKMILSVSKVKPYIKKSAENLSEPLALIFDFMQRCDHFPEVCNKTKCSFIGRPPKERGIFALDSFPKILETGVKQSFDNIKKEDGTIQCAYTANRGTLLCNLITLQEIELCNEPTIQCQLDLQKAFNRCDRKTMVREAQRKYGAGKLINSWFKNRTYSFASQHGSETRGKDHNCGIPAGTLIGVECFLLFIATATELTNKNLNLLWAALYADDTSPLVKESKVVDFQKALDWAFEWAKQKGCAFHLYGDKGPSFSAYLKKGMVYPDCFDSLKLGPADFKRTVETCVLGLDRKMRPVECPESNKSPCSEHSHGTLIDKYGYETSWNITKLKQLAYRLQHIKFRLVPEFIRKLVSSYFCGILRYSSSILWLRSSPAHIKRVRYYYCMAMASILGLTASEALNLSCCANESVTTENSSYHRLLERTGLPSIAEMAAQDAQTALKQVCSVRPEWFVEGSVRQKRNFKKANKLPITGVHPTCSNKLIDQIYQLSCSYQKEFGRHRKSISDKKEQVRINSEVRLTKAKGRNAKKVELDLIYKKRKEELSVLDCPILQRYYLARSTICEMSSTNKIDYGHLIRTFTLSCREEFNCLDTIDRVSNFKTPVRTNSDAQTSTATPTRQKRRKRNMVEGSITCDHWVGKKAFCKFCSVEFSTSRGSKRSVSHLLFECTGIRDSIPLPKSLRSPEKKRMKRLAEIGAVPDPGGLY